MNKEENKLSYVKILETFSQVDVAMLKSLLEGNVDYYFKDENFMSVRPLLEPSILMVRENQVDEVRTLLKDFELNYLGVSVKGEDESYENEKDEE